MRYFYDIEGKEIITEEQLYKEYKEMQNEQPENYDYSFSDYISNCLTCNNGTLEERKRETHFMGYNPEETPIFKTVYVKPEY